MAFAPLGAALLYIAARRRATNIKRPAFRQIMSGPKALYSEPFGPEGPQYMPAPLGPFDSPLRARRVTKKKRDVIYCPLLSYPQRGGHILRFARRARKTKPMVAPLGHITV